jgi:hypothetical protein
MVFILNLMSQIVVKQRIFRFGQDGLSVHNGVYHILDEQNIRAQTRVYYDI